MIENIKSYFDDGLPSSGIQKQIDKHEQEFPTRRQASYAQRLALGIFLARLSDEEPTLDKPALYEE